MKPTNNKTLIDEFELKLPPLVLFSDITSWVIAPNDCFKEDGIEEGDFLGLVDIDCDKVSDFPRDIYYVKFDNDFILLREDFTIPSDTDEYFVIFDSIGTKRLFDGNEKTYDIIGIVKTVVKAKFF